MPALEAGAFGREGSNPSGATIVTEGEEWNRRAVNPL